MNDTIALERQTESMASTPASDIWNCPIEPVNPWSPTTLWGSPSRFEALHEIVLDGEGIPVQGIVAGRVKGESLAKLEDEIDEVFSECGSNDWDGYGAIAVKEKTVKQAKKLLRRLPETTPPPNIGADPDGEICFDWFIDPEWNLTVSIGETGRVCFSGFFGKGRIRGIQSLSKVAVQRISIELKSLFEYSHFK